MRNIDLDYMGELMIVITIPTKWIYKKGEPIAHLLLLSVMPGHSDHSRSG